MSKCQDCIRRGELPKVYADIDRAAGNNPAAYCGQRGKHVPRKGGQDCPGYQPRKPKREASNG